MTYKNRAPFPSAAFVESQRNFTYFDKSLSSGLSDVTIESPGDFLYIDQESTGYVYLELNQRQSGTLAPILLSAGGSIECDFASIKLYAPAQLGKSVRIVIGNGAKIRPGGNVKESSFIVSSVDGGKARSIAGNAFLAGATRAASGSVVDAVQLWNPGTSGKNVIVEKVFHYLQSGTGNIAIGFNSSAITTLSSTANSKKPGAAASNAQLRTDVFGSYFWTSAWIIIPSTTTRQEIQLTEPIVLPPGYGLIVATMAAGNGMIANFEFFEE